jgi:hypothetical protein
MMEPIRRLLQQVRKAGDSTDSVEPLSITFSLEAEDLIEFSVHSTTKSPWKSLHRQNTTRSMGRSLVIWIVIGFVMTALFNILIRPSRSEGSVVLDFLCGGFIACVILSVLSAFARPRLIRKVMRKYLSDGTFELTLGPHQVDLRSDGLYCSGDFDEAIYRWTAIAKVEQLPSVIYLYLTSIRAIVVPRRAFLTDAEFNRFAAQAEQLCKAAHPQGFGP